jgi:putative transposase
MRSSRNPYAGYRYPGEIIAHAVWLYHRFCLSFRDVEYLLAERGITVSHETIRQWCLKFGRLYARSLRRRQGRPGDTWFLDEVFVTINGEALLPLAGGRSGRRCARHPGAESP